MVRLLCQFDVRRNVGNAGKVDLGLDVATNFALDVVAVVQEERVILQALAGQDVDQLVFVCAGDANIVDEDQHFALDELAIQVEVVVVDQAATLLLGQEAVVIRVRHFAVDDRSLHMVAVGINQQMIEAVDEVFRHDASRILHVVVWGRNDDAVVYQQHVGMSLEEGVGQLVTELASDTIAAKFQLRVLLGGEWQGGDTVERVCYEAFMRHYRLS